MKTLLVALSAIGMATAAQAHVTIFQGSFAPEVAGATGSGTLTLEYDEHGHTLYIDVTFSGLSGTTTNAHIHCCTAPPLVTTAGVALGNSAAGNNMLLGFPVGVTSGAYTATLDLTKNASYGNAFRNTSPAVGSFGAGTAAAAEVRVINGLLNGTAYFNIHSSSFTGGEIRAFVTAVPEPQTYALMLTGRGVLGWAARRKQLRG